MPPDTLPLGVDRDLANEALLHLRAALEKSDSARIAAEEMADTERAKCEEMLALAKASQAEARQAQQSMHELQARFDEVERRSRIAQLLCDRQTAALKLVAEENASLLSLMSGLPSLRSAVANGAAVTPRAVPRDTPQDANLWQNSNGHAPAVVESGSGWSSVVGDGVADQMKESRLVGGHGSRLNRR
eukprot:scaffold13347_cov132-Isochrysis_galbana.AAC.3